MHTVKCKVGKRERQMVMGVDGCDPDSSTDSESDVEMNATEGGEKKDTNEDEKLNERPYIHQRRGDETDTESSTGYESDSSTDSSNADKEESMTRKAKRSKYEDESEKQREEWVRLRLYMEASKMDKSGRKENWTVMYAELEKVRQKRDNLKAEVINALEKKIKMLKDSRTITEGRLQRRIDALERMDEKRRKRELKGKENLQIKVIGKEREIKKPTEEK